MTTLMYFALYQVDEYVCTLRSCGVCNSQQHFVNMQAGNLCQRRALSDRWSIQPLMCTLIYTQSLQAWAHQRMLMYMYVLVLVAVMQEVHRESAKLHSYVAQRGKTWPGAY